MKNIRILFIVAITILLSGCNSCNKTKLPTNDKMTPIKVKIGYIPIADCSQLYIGIEKGYFKEEGLDVEAIKFAGGPKILEALAGGSLDIGFSNLVSLVMANEGGLEFRALTGGPVEDKQHIENAILTLTDSKIKTPKDLEGKTIAVNTRKNIIELMLLSFLKQNKVNVSKIKIVEIPFPNMQNTLIAKQVDAIAVIEPFLTFAKKDVKISLLANYVIDVTPRLEISSYHSSQSWIDKNTETVKRFKVAMQKSTKFCLENSNEIIPILVKYTGLKTEQLQGVTLPTFTDKLTNENLQFIIDLMKEQSWVTKTYKASDLIR